MRILVTGAGGRVGSAAVKDLVEAGHDVVATDVKFTRGLPVRLHLADLRDHLPVYPLMEGCDAVLHLGNHPNAWAVSPSHRALTENTAMNTHVFAAAGDLGVERVVYISSVQAISAINRNESWRKQSRPCQFPYLPVDDDIPANPGLNPYGLSKTFGEQTLKVMADMDEKFRAVALRLPYVHLGELSVDKHYFAPLQPDDRRLYEALTYLPLADACAVMRAALEKTKPGYRVYFPTQAMRVEGVTPGEAAAKYLPHLPVQRPLDEVDGWVDNTRLREDLGWSPSQPALVVPVA